MNIDQAAFARLVGVDQSTVSRWERDVHEPEGEQLRALAAVAKEPIENFLTAARPVPATEGSPRTYSVRVIGSVQAGLWVEAIEWPSDQQFEIQVPLEATAAALFPRALRVQGPSMNREFAEGSYVLCVSVIELGAYYERFSINKPAVDHEDFVVVQRRRPDGLIEATIKQYMVDERGRKWLWPRSTEPEFQQPWPVPDGDPEDDGEDLRITAVVVGTYKATKQL